MEKRKFMAELFSLGILSGLQASPAAARVVFSTRRHCKTTPDGSRECYTERVGRECPDDSQGNAGCRSFRQRDDGPREYLDEDN
jgi:hypothetical protein